MRWLDGITNLMDLSLSKLWEMVNDWEVCTPWGCKEWDETEQEQQRIRDLNHIGAIYVLFISIALCLNIA